jgi:hypothetical protein
MGQKNKRLKIKFKTGQILSIRYAALRIIDTFTKRILTMRIYSRNVYLTNRILTNLYSQTYTQERILTKPIRTKTYAIVGS